MPCTNRHVVVTGASTGIGRPHRAGQHPHGRDKLERDVHEAEREFGPTGWALYGDAFTSMTARALAQETNGSDPDVVAAVVSRAIATRHPRTRYIVGKDARILAALARLPAPVLDALRRRFFELPRPGAKIVTALRARAT